MTPTLPDPHHPTSEELFAYRDGELTAERRSLIEAHVMACAQCSERLEEMSAAEAEIRRRPDGAGDEYFERMTESVMARIGAAGHEASAPSAAREAAPAAGAGTGSRLGGGYVDVPRVDRRRPDPTGDDDQARRRLRLPWIGIAGSTAAAVAVVIIAVVLFRGQNEWVRAPRPAVLGEPRSAAPAADSTVANEEKRGAVAGGTSATSRANAPAPREKAALSKKTERAQAMAKLKGASPVLGSPRGAGPTAKDETARMRDAAGVPPPAESQMERKAMAPQAMSGSVAQNLAPGAAAAGEAFSGVLRAYRLPPVWNPAVSTDAITRAEPDLRYLYQTGRAGADSARIRLYLAEAERARLTDPSNTEAVESISHHYRRAISLAGNDATLAATARRRLAEFEQEMTRARGSQP